MATFLKPDKVWYILGVPVKEYFLTKHNPNRIALPAKRTLNLVGPTVHNTPKINQAKGTTMAEQHVRATVNGNMGTVRVHFYVDDVEIWQDLPLDWQSWHAGQSGKAERNGSHYGNQATISIEVIGNSPKAEQNAAKLVAWLLNKYNMTVDDVYTHNYWVNVRNGVKAEEGEDLRTKPDGYKSCPIYIIPHWPVFLSSVKSFMHILKNEEYNNSVTEGDCSLLVRVLDPALNVRSAPGTKNDIVYVIEDNGVYTITETKMVGFVEWGRLKSGIGWISLGNKYVVKL